MGSLNGKMEWLLALLLVALIAVCVILTRCGPVCLLRPANTASNTSFVSRHC